MKHLKNSFVLLLTLFMLMGSSVCKAETISAIRISTADELKEFRNSVNMGTSGPKMAARNYDTSNKSWSSKISAYVFAYEAYVILDADINLSLNTQWIPIGKNSTYYFNGTFDGNGHTIISPSGFSNTTKEYYGIFGYLRGTVKNLTVRDGCTITDEVNNVGLIVAYSNGGTISNCKVRLGIIARQSNNVGNFVGKATYSTIENCTMIDGDIAGHENVGIIAGYITSSTVKNCYAQSCMAEGNENVGGLIGLAEYENTIEGCYMDLGYVDGKKDYIGGLIGCIYGDRNTVTIKNCYSTGLTRLNGRTDYQGKRVGEFVGNDDGYTVYENCYHYYSTTERVPLIGRLSPGAENSIIKNCYYNRYFNEDISNVVIGNGEKPNEGSFQGVDESLFKSGALTYKINGNSTSNPIYVQKIGSESTPSLYSSTNKNIVYPHYKHGSNTYDVYSNNSTDYHNTPNSTYNHDNYIVASTGKCSACGAECLPPLVSGYYEISTEKHLKKFAQMVNNGSSNINGLLKRDISLTSAFTPIGNSSKIYTGTFDGAGHTISNLKISANSLYIGLFGYSKGVIRNLTVSGNVTNDFNSSDNSSYTGMIVGRLEGTIENCYTSGSVTVPNGSAVGGLAGSAAKNFEIKSCGNNATVKGIHAIGGIVGRANLDKDNSLLEKCYNTGTITGTGNNIGGLIGYVYSDNTQRNVTFENCYNTGAIKGESTSVNVGGLVGRFIPKATFTSCFSAATVSGGSARTGAVVGYMDQNITTATNCYFNSSMSSKAIGSGTLSTGEFTGVTTTVFASGKVAYDLNNGNTTNPIYTQYIDNDKNPVIRKDLVETSIVYAQYKHGSNEIIGYKNKGTITFHSQPNSIEDHDLGIDNLTGKCTICGSYCRPPLVNGCYEISSQRELEQFANMVNKGSTTIKGILKKDIVLSDNFTPIGNSTNPFNGTFDGAGYTISNLKITANSQYVGLFGYSKGVIRNLTVSGNVTNDFNSTEDNGSYTGMIVGKLEGTIENCYTSGSVTVPNGSAVGGLAGYAVNNFEIKYCGNNATVTGIAIVGGIIGQANLYKDNLLFEKCYNTGTITGTGQNIGGLIGHVYSSYTQRNLSFENCYNTGAIKGESTSLYVGGLVGYLQSKATFTSCYSSANVDGKSTRTGAAIGAIAANLNITATNCYYNSDKNSKAIGSGTLSTGEFTGATTAEFESGAITYALNNGNTEDPVFTQFLTSKWTIAESYSKEEYPVIRKIRDDKSIIYAFYIHGSSDGIYSNSVLSNYHTTPDTKIHDQYITEWSGICSLCKQQCRPPYESGYYLIKTGEHLHLLSRMVNQGDKCDKVKLMNDVSTSSNLTPIGTKEKPFTGEFEGYSHSVTITVNTPSEYAGLFGYSEGTIKDLTVEGSVTSTSKAENSYTGMIVGFQQGGSIEKCEANGSVKDGKYTGGLVGWADGTKFDKSMNTSSVSSANGTYVGGLIGYCDNSTINYCYNNHNVTGGKYTGGLVGCSKNSRYSSCYSDCSTKGTYVGAIMGRSVNSTATNCYFNSESISKAISSGDVYSGNYTGATTEDFHSGAITYALNEGVTANPVYTQYLTNDYAFIDFSPVIRRGYYTNSAVYLYYKHGESHGSYTNTRPVNCHTLPDNEDYHDHYISANGNCSICNSQIIKYNNGYYEIENYGMLKKFASLVSNGNASIKAKLTNNIVANKQLLNASGDVTGVPAEIWTPINNFKGEFDGQGYTISGLYVDVNDTHGNAGLFDYVNGATIKNVHIVDSYFRGATVGAICVTADGNTKIEKCSNQSTVKGNSVAAICHNAMDVSISYCYNTGANVPLVGKSLKDTDCYIYGSYNAKYGKENTNVVLNNCYYLADEYTTDGGCTESQFNNGVVCWLLNGKQGISNLTWRQNPGDKYPSFTGSVVTKASMHCDHVYGSDFKCLICGDRKQLEVEDGFCLIHNSDELTLFALKVNEDKETTIKARLTNNIVANKQLLNASGEVTGVPTEIWTPINNFSGEFDGQGYTISGLYVNDAKEDVGLFNRLVGATIKNVHIVDSYFNGANAGAICASAEGGTKIYRCSNQSTVKGTGIIGAICGIPMNVSISYCYNTGANQPLVGISLDKEACTIENSYNAKPYKEKGYLTYTNSYYLADEYATDGGCTESQFANGEVCWLLNGKKETSDVIWRQNPGDKYPSFEGVVVKGSEKKYNELHLSDEECDFANGKSYETVTYTRKVNSDAHSAHWGTVCLPFSFNESNCAGGVKFYEVTNVTESGIEINQITHVEAGQAVLFYNAGDWSVSVSGPVVATNTVIEGDPMTGTYKQKDVMVGNNNYFYVKENKFYKGNTSFKVPAFHAYLEGTGVNTLNSFSIARDNVMEETIEEETAEEKTISAIYTVNGQRISEMNGKGVYIVVFSDGTSKKVHIVE